MWRLTEDHRSIQSKTEMAVVTRVFSLFSLFSAYVACWEPATSMYGGRGGQAFCKEAAFASRLGILGDQVFPRLLPDYRHNGFRGDPC